VEVPSDIDDLDYDELHEGHFHEDEIALEDARIETDTKMMAGGRDDLALDKDEHVLIDTERWKGKMDRRIERPHNGLDGDDRVKITTKEKTFDDRIAGQLKLEKDDSMEVDRGQVEIEETKLLQDSLIVRPKDLKLDDVGYLEVGLGGPKQHVTWRQYDNLMGKYLKVCAENEMLRAASPKQQVKEYTFIRFSCSVI
jgi:hypothetical protein